MSSWRLLGRSVFDPSRSFVTIANVFTLRNGLELPVVFSLYCQAGRYDEGLAGVRLVIALTSRNFAEATRMQFAWSRISDLHLGDMILAFGTFLNGQVSDLAVRDQAGAMTANCKAGFSTRNILQLRCPPFVPILELLQLLRREARRWGHAGARSWGRVPANEFVRHHLLPQIGGGLS